MASFRAGERAIIEAVTYAALFDYPLTSAQIAESLPEVQANERMVERWWSASTALQSVIEWHDGYYFPRGRGEMVAQRRRREAISHTLLERHRPAISLLASLPFVRMVALSGSIAHLNADEDGDLDLFVVTAPGRVWLVTTMAIVAAKLGGWRRRLCLNFVVSERALEVAPQDLFTANQILHLRPLTGGAVYRQFLGANPWVRTYYPNFEPRPLSHWCPVDRRSARVRRALEWPLRLAATPFERLCRLAYRRHLERHRESWLSRDQVRLEAECLKLHTHSHRADVLARFDAALAVTLEPLRRRLIG